MKRLKLIWRAFKDVFIDWNWCENNDSDGNPKAVNWLQDIYRWSFWPIYKQPEPCWCCASFRGILYGLPLGALLLRFWNWTAFWIIFWIAAAFWVIMIGRRTRKILRVERDAAAEAELARINKENGGYDF